MSLESILIVQVNIRREAGILSARSGDLPGLFVNADNMEQMCDLVAKAIKAIFKYERSMDVEVRMVADNVREFPKKPGIHALNDSHERFAVMRHAA